MLEEFKAFLTKTNALALAVGVIIGAAAGKIVTKLVEDIMMPIIGMALPAGDWRDAQVRAERSPRSEKSGQDAGDSHQIRRFRWAQSLISFSLRWSSF